MSATTTATSVSTVPTGEKSPSTYGSIVDINAWNVRPSGVVANYGEYYDGVTSSYGRNDRRLRMVLITLGLFILLAASASAPSLSSTTFPTGENRRARATIMRGESILPVSSTIVTMSSIPTDQNSPYTSSTVVTFCVRSFGDVVINDYHVNYSSYGGLSA